MVSWTSVAGALGEEMAGSGWAGASQSDGIWGGQAERFWSGVIRRGERGHEEPAGKCGHGTAQRTIPILGGSLRDWRPGSVSVA